MHKLTFTGSQNRNEAVAIIGNITLFTSGDTTRPILNAAKASVSGGVLRLVATDSYSMAWADISCDLMGDHDLGLWPADALKAIAKGKNKLVSIDVDTEAEAMVVEFGDTVQTFKLQWGEFPKVENLVLKNFAPLTSPSFGMSLTTLGKVAKLKRSDGKTPKACKDSKGFMPLTFWSQESNLKPFVISAPKAGLSILAMPVRDTDPTPPTF